MMDHGGGALSSISTFGAEIMREASDPAAWVRLVGQSVSASHPSPHARGNVLMYFFFFPIFFSPLPFSVPSLKWLDFLFRTGLPLLVIDIPFSALYRIYFYFLFLFSSSLQSISLCLSLPPSPSHRHTYTVCTLRRQNIPLKHQSIPYDRHLDDSLHNTVSRRHPFMTIFVFEIPMTAF